MAEAAAHFQVAGPHHPPLAIGRLPGPALARPAQRDGCLDLDEMDAWRKRQGLDQGGRRDQAPRAQLWRRKRKIKNSRLAKPRGATLRCELVRAGPHVSSYARQSRQCKSLIR